MPVDDVVFYDGCLAIIMSSRRGRVLQLVNDNNHIDIIYQKANVNYVYERQCCMPMGLGNGHFIYDR